jgi:hypothetical protein
MHRLVFQARPRAARQLAGLLQRGCKVPIRLGVSLETLFLEDLKFPPDLIADRIQTIFLDGIPVDNLETATVKDGSTLALSSALPGLVGASFRKGGYYSALRLKISSETSITTPHPGTGWITLKLFNLLLNDCGPHLLGQGVHLERHILLDFFSHKGPDFWREVAEMTLDDRAISREELAKWLPENPDALVCLKVLTSKG